MDAYSTISSSEHPDLQDDDISAGRQEITRQVKAAVFVAHPLDSVYWGILSLVNARRHPMKHQLFLVFTLWCFLSCGLDGSEQLRIATFQVDASPPLGSPVAYAPAREITDPLSARGIILLGGGKPIVLCAVDFLGIGNRGYEVWRERLADAAHTSVDRVAVHALHQHDGPRCDFDVEQVLARHGMAGQRFDVVFCRQLIDQVGAAVGQAIDHETHRVTHVGIGKGRVQGVASNRRLLGSDGQVEIVRFSKSTDPKAISAPDGVIDPWLRMVTFWNEDSPLAVLSYYATHPQSYYGQGDVTCEFVGLARNKRQQETETPHIHFNGASGNVAAGKYNDGSPQMRSHFGESPGKRDARRMASEPAVCGIG